MKTLSVKQTDIKRKQHRIDATDKILGRLATEVACLLMGKGKPLFSRNADCGDFVSIINAEKVRVTGRKAEQKIYYWHSGYPGGFKERTYRQIMETHPKRLLEYAVEGMLPYNRLRARMMTRLKVYAGGIPAPKPQKPKAEKKTVRPKAEKKAAEPKAEKQEAAPTEEKKA
ncbi:MAG: 50S ribosomal protein L13 [Dehalococcoidia bacterium]|nr:50S ribosomal protein L13 [Dehalococcoidia bacterium]